LAALGHQRDDLTVDPVDGVAHVREAGAALAAVDRRRAPISGMRRRGVVGARGARGESQQDGENERPDIHRDASQTRAIAQRGGSAGTLGARDAAEVNRLSEFTTYETHWRMRISPLFAWRSGAREKFEVKDAKHRLRRRPFRPSLSSNSSRAKSPPSNQWIACADSGARLTCV